jgi:hypothetical protein
VAGVEGFEPPSTVLETAILPLNYTPTKTIIKIISNKKKERLFSNLSFRV